MNFAISPRCARGLFPCALLICALSAIQAQATTRYFDVNDVATGSGVTNAGSYSWESNVWNTNDALGTTAATAWTDGDFPKFSAGTDATVASYTVTASAVHTVNGFQLATAAASPGTILNINTTGGGALNVGSGLQGVFVATNGTLKINAPLGGVDATSALQWSGGGGSLNLYGANTFAGGVSLNTVNGLNFNNNNSFGAGPISWNVATQVVAAPDATAAINIGNTMTTRSASTLIMATFAQPVTWSGGWTLATGGNSTLDIRSGVNTTISGVIAGTDTASGLVKGGSTGTGTLTLSNANTFVGPTTIAAGTVSVSGIGLAGAASNLGKNGTINLGGGGTTTTTGTLLYTGTGESSDKVLNLGGTTGGGIIDQSGTGALVFSSNMTATGAGIKTLTLQGSTAGTGEIAGKIVDNSATNKTSVTKAGTGTWTLSGANTYTGTTTVSAGTLKMASATAVPSANPLALGGGTLNNSTGALKTISGATTLSATSTLIENSAAENFTFSGNFTNSGGNRVLTGGNGAGTAGGTITLSNNVFLSEITGTGRTFSLAGSNTSTPNFLITGNVANFNGSGTAGSIQVGNGSNASAATLTLKGTNTYTGATNVSTASLLNIGSAGALSSSTLTMTGTGSFDNTTGASLTLSNNLTLSGGSPTFVGTNDLSFGNNTVTISGANRSITTTAGTLTIGSIGQDASARNLTKAGLGTLVIVGSGTYTGTTIVNGGTLLANNTTGSATGSGPITLTSGTLGGTGSMSGAVTAGGGALSPGGSVGAIGALAIGALTFNTGSSYVYDLNSNSSSGDLLNANGALNLPALGGATLSLTDAGSTVLTPGTKLTLISYAGAWNNATFDGFADDSQISVGVNQFVIDYNDPNGNLSGNLNAGSFTNYVTLTAVPEANAFWLGGAICLVLGLTVGTRKLIGNRVA